MYIYSYTFMYVDVHKFMRAYMHIRMETCEHICMGIYLCAPARLFCTVCQLSLHTWHGIRHLRRLYILNEPLPTDTKFCYNTCVFFLCDFVMFMYFSRIFTTLRTWNYLKDTFLFWLLEIVNGLWAILAINELSCSAAYN